MEFLGLDWFNLSSPQWPIPYPRLRRIPEGSQKGPFLTRWYRGLWGTVRMWNLFNRRTTDGHFWGLGVAQIQSRHLFAVIKGQRLCVDVCFLHVWGRPG